jgi:hypothetical protein
LPPRRDKEAAARPQAAPSPARLPTPAYLATLLKLRPPSLKGRQALGSDAQTRSSLALQLLPKPAWVARRDSLLLRGSTALRVAKGTTHSLQQLSARSPR